MASILDLVDLLIGDALLGNIYTDSKPYSHNLNNPPPVGQTTKASQGPSPSSPSINTEYSTPLILQNQPTQESHIPNIDPRDLNFNVGSPHPHSEQRNVIPSPVHDTRGSFSDGNGRIVGSKRQEIYSPNSGRPPPDLRRQTSDRREDRDLEFSKQNVKPGESGRVTDTARRRLGPDLAKLQSLVDFHEKATQAPKPTFTAEQRSQDSSFPPRTPEQAGPTQKVGNQIVNEFVGSQHRPLNFDADNAPNRGDLVSSNHPQKFGWNATGEEPTAQRRGVISDNRYSDSDVPFEGNFLSVFRGPAPGSVKNHVNILATGHWLRNVATEFGIPLEGTDATPVPGGQPSPEPIIKGATFLTTQALLTSFNHAFPNLGGPGNVIWNPLSIAGALPLVGNFDPFNITIAAAFGGNYQDRVRALDGQGLDRISLMKEGGYVEISPVHRLSKLKPPISPPGFIGDTTGELRTFDDELPIPPIQTIGSTLENNQATELVRVQGRHTNIYGPSNQYSAETAIHPQEQLLEDSERGLNPGEEKLANLFDYKPFPGAGKQFSFALPGQQETIKPGTWVVKPRAGQSDGITNTFGGDAPGLNAAVVPAGYPTENDESLIEDEPLSDSDVYMPFTFEDLREPEGEKKFLYFRAFLKGDLSENFTPDWQTQHFYGRVDQVPIYKGTIRTINVSFDIAAFTRSDLPVVWRKLNKLQSMVYPAFDLRGFITSGPIIRMRIGDLVAGKNKRGLPGYITGMDWSFPDGLWEVDTDFKVPRMISVSLSFTVVHDGNPGIYPKVAYELDKTGEEVGEPAPAERSFGAARFNKNSNDNVDVKVSTEEIRRIFANVKN